jgi:Mg2+/Co2+ transporter CorB
MTAVSQPRMFELERRGNRRAGQVNALRANKERLIGSILLGNNLVNILASALATSMFIGWLGNGGVVYATLVMTLLVLIFAEVMPKAYALHHADRLALSVAPMMQLIVFVFAPIARTIQFVVEGTLRLFGVRFDTHLSGFASEDELRGIISMHQGPEPEVQDEREMLRSVLDLGDLEVGEVMTHRSSVVMIDASKSAADIVDEVLSSPHTRLPIYEGETDNITGVIHAKDLLRAVQQTKGNVDALDIRKIAAAPWFIPESTSLLDQLRAFRQRREHFAIVVDEYGSLMGIVTLEDIIEEIVGDISDEHDAAVAGIRPAGANAWIVNGEVTIRDLNRELGWDLPDEHASTVAGLVMHEARRIPEVKQVFAFHGIRFEILRRRNHRITSIRVSPLEPEEAETASGTASE